MVFYSRRRFLKTGLVAGAIASAVGSMPLAAAEQAAGQVLAKPLASDLVTLGHSGVKVSRLAFGTGSYSGEVQRSLGQQGFNTLVRYAYDRGIRFFETAESYGDMHRMLGIALQGIPRDSYQLMSKLTTREGVNPQQKFDELRSLAKTDYFDIMLLHWQHTGDWPEESRRWADGIDQAQQRKIVVARGASVHGLPALRQVPSDPWLQVAMIRTNHKGVRMDAEDYATGGLGNVSEVVQHIHQTRKQGVGVIGMKLIGEGVFDHVDRQAAMRFAMKNAGIDCASVGFKSKAEIDEAINNMNMALA